MKNNDISKKVSSIEEVQKTEADAKKVVEKAQEKANLVISGAKETAAKIISDAETESKKRMSDEIAEITAEEEKKFGNALEKGAKEAKVIGSKRLSSSSMDKLAFGISKEILGE
jgi:vacuolar-type H+-ATPase subunit H